MQIERTNGIALLRMNTGKANAMSPASLRALGELVDELGDARAAVITGYDTFFSAGLALPALVDLSRSEVTGFMDLFRHTMLRVFELPIPVVAAINGHAIAGGCVLALQADYRVMAAAGGKIGLSEVQLGIGLPAVVIETLRAQIPARALRPVALEGRLLIAEEAEELGLIDEIADPADLLHRAHAVAERLARAPAPAYAQIKRALRDPILDAIERTRAGADDAWLDTWFSDEGQQRLRAAAAKLR